MEIFNGLSKEEKKEFKKKMTSEQKNELLRLKAQAEISRGNKRLQALKATERKEDTRKLILLGVYFKRVLSESNAKFISQCSILAKEEMLEDEEIIKNTESEALQIKEKLKDKDYNPIHEEAKLLKQYRFAAKRLSDNKIIVSIFDTLETEALEDETETEALEDET